MRVMGLDPSLARTGVGVISADPRGVITLLYQRDIAPRPDWGMGARLRSIGNTIETIAREEAPDVVAMERAFIGGHRVATTASAMVRGVCLFSLYQVDMIAEYAPMQVKKGLTGSGKASKAEVRDAVENVLGADVYNEDIADALAVAIHHANVVQGVTMMERLER